MTDTSTRETAKPARRPRPARKWLRRLAILLLVLAAAAAVLYFTPVEMVVTGYGNIMAHDDAILRPGVKGVVAEQLVRTGQPVRRGQILLRLEDSAQQADLIRAQRLLAEAQAELTRMAHAHALQRAEQQAEIRAAELRARSAKKEMDSLKELAGSGGVSPQEIWRAELAHDLAQAQLAAASIAREELLLAQIDVQKRHIETLEAGIELVKRQIELRRVRSPIDGRVFMHEITPGQVVDANQVLGQVFDESRFVVYASFPEADTWFLRPGQTVEVEPAPYPSGRFGYLAGRVEWVSGVVDPRASGDGFVRLCADVEPPARTDVQLKPGMTATVIVHVGRTRLLYRLLPFRVYSLLETYGAPPAPPQPASAPAPPAP